MGSEAQELGLKATWNLVSCNGIWLQENSQSWAKGTCNPMDCNGRWLQGKSQSGPKGTCNPVGCNGIPLQGKSIYNSYTLLIPLTSNWPLTTVLPFCLLGHSLIFQVSFTALWAQNWAALLCIQFSGNTWAWASSFSLQTDKISVPMWLEKFFSGALISLWRALPFLSLLQEEKVADEDITPKVQNSNEPRNLYLNSAFPAFWKDCLPR